MLVAGLAWLGAAPALAQEVRLPTNGQYSFALSAGPEFDIDSEFHGGTVAGPVTIQSRDFDDVYDYTLNVQAEIAYGLPDLSEVALVLGWTSADAGDLQVGEAGGLPITGDFDDYTAWTLRAEYRRYFEVSPGFFPFVGVTGGIRHVDQIDATFTSAALPTLGLPTSIDVPFYEDSWVPTIGLSLGWRTSYEGIALGLETGLYYDWELSDDDSGIAALGLSTINDAGERLYVPVRLTIAY